jgi:hypothetical protein
MLVVLQRLGHCDPDMRKSRYLIMIDLKKYREDALRHQLRTPPHRTNMDTGNPPDTQKIRP